MGSGARDAAGGGRALICIGWDPGLKSIAYGVLELGPTRSRCLEHAMLAKGLPVETLTRDELLDELATRIDGVMNTWTPDAMGYEDQTGVNVAMEKAGLRNGANLRVHEVVGMIRFAARCSLAEPVPVYKVQPRVIKVALLGKGHGAATKLEVKWGVERLFGVKTNEHAADAIACAVASARSHRVALSSRRRAS